MKKYKITVNGNQYEVEVEEVGGSHGISQNLSSVASNAGETRQAPVSAPAPAPAVKVDEVVEVPQEHTQPVSKSGSAGSVVINAPVPGTILDINVTPGQEVAGGDVLCVLEAMKMENDIVSPQSGVVASVNVAKGDSVEVGDILITLN